METNFITNLAGMHKNHAFLQSMFEELRLSIWYRGVEDASFWVSSEAARIYGYPQKELENRPSLCQEFVFSEDRHIVECHREQLLLGSPSTIEYRITQSDGTVRWVQEEANSLKDEHGKVVLYTGIVLDITKQKTAVHQLAEWEEQYRQFIELSSSSIFLCQAETVVYVNNSALKAMEVSCEKELIGKSLEDLFMPQGAGALKNQLDKVIRGKEPSVRNMEVRMHNGKLMYVELGTVPALFDGKLTVMLVGKEEPEENGRHDTCAQMGIHMQSTEKGLLEESGLFFSEKIPSPVHHSIELVQSRGKGQVIEAEKSIKYEDFYDYLTGLPNRSGLHARLSDEILRASSLNKSFAVLLLNLDRFKVVNDTLDHTAGDLLLKEVTIRLKSSIYDNDMIFRQSGDEFLIVLRDADRAVASNVAKRILDALSAPFTIKNHRILTSASIGISLFKEDGETAEDLIKHADSAMCQAKKAGKNTYKFYFSKGGGFKLNPLKMEIDLYKAIERDELSLHYQPKVNLKTGNIVGFEGLLRWNHPDWGLLPPASFIPFAEETGLIIPIGKWALYHACKQNKQWHQKGYLTVIAVNLSVRQLRQPDIVATVADVLQKTELDPRYLELEIIGSIAEDTDRILSALKQLKNLGVQISMDDFGTEFSSLHYLKQFPVDTLKIDQSFIRELRHNPDEEAIVKNIILMAHNLKLNVIAEGIETEEQLLFLQQHLCDEGQGYFFSPPLPADEIENTFSKVQQLMKKHGLPDDVNERMWVRELLDRAKQEMQETIRLQQGMTFKFKKIHDQFIHTLCDGELLYRMGLTPSQVVGKVLYDFMPPKAAADKEKSYRRAWEEEEVVTYESTINGIDYLSVLCPVKKGGKVVEVIGSAVDITDRKQVEEALQESEEKYRLIADNMTDLICLLDSSGHVVYTSPSHATVLGYPQEELGGDKTIAKMHPEDVEFFQEEVKQIIETNHSSQVEFRFLHADGRWLLIECVGTPVLGENGAVEHVVMVGRDITEKRKAEELLLKSEKLTVVGELAAGVAHEIRNPLTSIKGFVQLLQQGMIKEEFFEVIMAEFDRVECIIKEFLTLAKPQEIQLRKININKVLEDVETLLRSEAHLQNVQILHETKQFIPSFMCDPNQIKQVFINLLKNSIEAMPDGGIVHIQSSIEGPNVLITITDNGMGIKEERIQKLGEPFYSNKEKGTGLGLMLCFRIIRQHKGTIVFKSKENEGTTVEVRLPLFDRASS
ncbi:EAL domain-containing protein [Domibacillus sp. PGB-M46]|uniref:EAL domain-containing protein n=1 Tax=Domibacillus sp. PGB-M46 TaxID=2910255 RepID=UPI001F5866B0|nr:EAL domain-containing protein [Domibacillus sp. PGB-M46]MCI2255215.1 EAL domain-containing protein [Domibacillus sp. PGB-M46]